MKKITLCLAFLIVFVTESYAQVSTYAFSQSTGTYTPITGGTIVATATGASGAASLDDLNYTGIPIPFTFTFDGAPYTSLNINTNGHVTFGTAGLTNNYTPISNTGTYSGGISAAGRDLNALFNILGNTGEIRFETIGTAPNQIFVIQYSNFRPYSTSTSTTLFWRWNFQIRLNETTNAIDVVYDYNFVGAPTASTTTNEVGLRGASNAFPANVNNRLITSGTHTWNTSVSGSSNASKCAYSTTLLPVSGKTFTWSIPSCIAPTVSVANITATTADLSWTVTSGNYEYVFDQVATDPTGSGTVTTATTYNATGLTGNSTYYLHVRSNCGGTFSTWSTRIFTTLMINDNLSGALPVTCGSTYTGSTATATLDEDSAPDGYGADMDAPNVWYSFTGSGSPQTVTLDLCASSYDSSVLVYTGTSGALTLIAGNDDDSSCGTRSKVTFTSDGTTTYKIAIEGYNVGSVGAFSMTVSCVAACTPAVANQACTTSLLVNVDGSTTNSDNSCGDAAAVQPSCDTFGTIQDVWFSFVAPASGNVDVTFTRGTMTSGNFTVLEGTCGATTEITGTCNSNITVATSVVEVLTGLTPGNTYFVQVWSSSAEQGTFSLVVSQACAIPTGIAASNITMVSADLSWTTTSGNYEYVLDQVVTNPAGAGTMLAGEAYSASSLTQGTTYYFHVRSDCGAGLYSAWATYSFTTLVSPPVNDDCSAPILLTLGAIFTDQYIDTTNTGGTLSAETPSPSCGITGFATSGKDVWYSVVVPPSGGITIETDATAAGTGLLLDTVISIYSGTCVALVELGCDDFSGNTATPVGADYSLLSLTGQTPGDTLLIRAFGWNGLQGNFSISGYDASLSTPSFDMAGFSAYPNPIKDVLNLSYIKEISNVSVHNLLGQEVMTKKINATQSKIDMSNLTNGTYLVKVTIDGLVKNLKVVKQ